MVVQLLSTKLQCRHCLLRVEKIVVTACLLLLLLNADCRVLVIVQGFVNSGIHRPGRKRSGGGPAPKKGHYAAPPISWQQHEQRGWWCSSSCSNSLLLQTTTRTTRTKPFVRCSMGMSCSSSSDENSGTPTPLEADTNASVLFQQEDKEMIVKPSSFGESVSIRNRPRKASTTTTATSTTTSSSNAPTNGAAAATTTTAETSFRLDNGIVDGTSKNGQPNAPQPTTTATALVDNRSDARKAADNLLRRNKLVAVASITWAVLGWTWQVLHPVPPIQLLAEMERRSPDVSVVGRNGKPTVVDFWAPWCENCKLSAATMHAIETEYGDRVNFIVVNGDDMVRNSRLVETFRVDSIPHVALVEADGTVDTALIGPVPKRVLRANLDVLLENSRRAQEEPDTPPVALPYQMLDVFENRPGEDRRVSF